MTLTLDRLASPIGDLVIAVHDARLCALDLDGDEARVRRNLQARYGRVGVAGAGARPEVARRLEAYFAGDLAALDTVAVETGGTSFQRDVWAALRTIACGTTTSYGALARRLGCPGASRAVGRANALNPVAIVVPCHRVVGADGTLTGYAGGLHRKRWLLAHEGVGLRGERVVGERSHGAEETDDTGPGKRRPEQARLFS